MNVSQKDDDAYAQFCRNASILSGFKGQHYVEEIWILHGNCIHPTRLYHLYSTPETRCLDSDCEYFYLPKIDYLCYYPPELPIELTDYKAINQVREAIKSMYIQLIQARKNNDLARYSDLKAELEKYHNYLKDGINRNGHLKTLNKLTSKHSLLIYKSVRHYLLALTKINPSLAKYIDEHLVIGVKCYWSETPITKKKRTV